MYNRRCVSFTSEFIVKFQPSETSKSGDKMQKVSENPSFREIAIKVEM